MLTKDKSKSPKPRITRPKKDNLLTSILNRIDKIASYFKLQHLTKLVNKKDVPQIVCLIVIAIIFIKVFPLASNQNTYFLGLPYSILISFAFLIAIIIVVYIYKTRLNK